jgi:succinate dehydrogenase / fumarate reductase membrane anchor subunit
MSSASNLRHPMKTARGLGSAKSGLHHWLAQRISAIALAPLSVWFVWHATWLFSADYMSAMVFLTQPLNAMLMAVFAVTLLYHSYLGLQVVVEDYVANEFKKLATLVVLQFIHVLLAVAAVFAVLKVVL